MARIEQAFVFHDIGQVFLFLRRKGLFNSKLSLLSCRQNSCTVVLSNRRDSTFLRSTGTWCFFAMALPRRSCRSLTICTRLSATNRSACSFSPHPVARVVIHAFFIYQVVLGVFFIKRGELLEDFTQLAPFRMVRENTMELQTALSAVLSKCRHHDDACAAE